MSISKHKWSHLNRYERLCLQPIMDVYDQIQAMEEDILIIAENYQLPTQEIERAKDYAFGNGVARYQFYPDIDMSRAWLRLAKGEGTDVDRVLLLHEIYESQLVIIQGMNQQQAHSMAQKHYPWSDLLNPSS
ncbi:MAG: hypothetical protein KA717_32920 [Woronichinia naegeliana WA131]|jgi:hypothetical protein|uniref:Uncharacterized protein n=1 Tax=Woronichinia naegeliana WA131 TaxID=2824559 RepID=A0A977KUR6_9CYAN|nr:MAG: hypothetical protein KA717_32920 [Woronichinia naegeliana WA131]